MVKLLLSQRTGTVTTRKADVEKASGLPIFSRGTRMQNDENDEEFDTTLSDPDYVPRGERDLGEYNEEPIEELHESSLNGGPSKELPENANSDDPDWPESKIAGRVRRSRPEESPVEEPSVGSPDGAWALQWNAEVKKYRHVYNWDPSGHGGKAPRVAGSRRLHRVKGHRHLGGLMVKRDPEPAEYSETGMSLSITHSLDTLREKVLREQRKKQNKLQREREQRIAMNRQKTLQNLG